MGPGEQNPREGNPPSGHSSEHREQRDIESVENVDVVTAQGASAGRLCGSRPVAILRELISSDDSYRGFG